jgi:hypothetical protein
MKTPHKDAPTPIVPRCTRVTAEGQRDTPAEIVDALIALKWDGSPVELYWTSLAQYDFASTVNFISAAQMTTTRIMPHWFLLTTSQFLVAYAPRDSWCPICRAQKALESSPA